MINLKKVRILYYSTSTHKGRTRKIKTLVLYNSNSIYSLFRTLIDSGVIEIRGARNSRTRV